MPDDVHKICRQIAEEMWKGEMKDLDISNTWDKEAFIHKVGLTLFVKTSVPKMVEVVRKTSTMSWNTLDEHNSRQRFKILREGAKRLFTALQDDKPVEESESSFRLTSKEEAIRDALLVLDDDVPVPDVEKAIKILRAALASPK